MAKTIEEVYKNTETLKKELNNCILRFINENNLKDVEIEIDVEWYKSNEYTKAFGTNIKIRHNL